jgi:hypothetical protein
LAVLRFAPAFCREQAALQLAKAESEPLENRKKIALAAAKAWTLEAALADKQVARATPLDALDTKIAKEFADEDPASHDLA